MGKGTVALKNLNADGDKVSFEEPLTINGDTLVEAAAKHFKVNRTEKVVLVSRVKATR